MKDFGVCVESYFFNNSDCKDCDNYYFNAKDLQDAKEYAKMCIDNWNKESKGTGIIYGIVDVWEVR